MSSPRFEVVVARSTQEIEAHLPAWWELHDLRLEDNIFTSPAFLPEIYRHYGGEINVGFAYRVTTSGRNAGGRCALRRPKGSGRGHHASLV